MLTGIQPYSTKQCYVKPNFQASLPKNKYIPVKNKDVKLSKNIMKNFISNVKEILFEIFPKLDPEFTKYSNKLN